MSDRGLFKSDSISVNQNPSLRNKGSEGNIEQVHKPHTTAVTHPQRPDSEKLKSDEIRSQVKSTDTNLSSPPPPPPVSSHPGGAQLVRQPNLPLAFNRFFRPNPVSHPIYPPCPIFPPPFYAEALPPQPRILNYIPFHTEFRADEEPKGPRNSPQTSGAGNKLSNPSSNPDERPGTSILDSNTEGRDTNKGKVGSRQKATRSKQEDLKKKSQTQLNEDSPHEKRTKEAEEKEPTTTADLTKDVIENSPDFQMSTVDTAEVQVEKPLGIFDKYPFGEIKSDFGDQLEEGVTDLCHGDLNSAAIKFEETLKTKWPLTLTKIRVAWLCLGVTQAANEQDVLAIIAMREYFDRDNKDSDLAAFIFLTISYLNENYINLAMMMIWKWLNKHPRYSDLGNLSLPESVKDVNSPVNFGFHRILLNRLLTATNRFTPEFMDPDLQCCIGFMYNIISEYSKAAGCFRASLRIDSTDEVVWRFLGDALLNDQKFPEAIEAYQTALNLRPKYVRARYNVGVSHSKMGNHENAMRHYLRALNIQAKTTRGLTGTMTDTIWLSVKMTLEYLGRRDLEEAVDKQDIELLNREFDFQPELLEENDPDRNNTVRRFVRCITEDY